MSDDSLFRDEDFIASSCEEREEDEEDADKSEEGDEEENDSNLFSFYRSEQDLVSEVNSIIRSLLTRPDITPRQISQIGRFLFALERLPRITPGISMEVTLVYRCNNETTYESVSLDEDSFRLSSGGSAYDPSVGGDSFSSTTLEVGVGWRDEPWTWVEVADWLERFRGVVNDSEYDIEISVYGDESVDWSLSDQEEQTNLWETFPDDDSEYGKDYTSQP